MHTSIRGTDPAVYYGMAYGKQYPAQQTPTVNKTVTHKGKGK